MSGASKLEGQNHHPSIHQPSILRVQDSILLHKKQARKQEEPESSSSKREQQPADGVQQQQAQRDASMAAAYQVLEVTLISAKDLKRVTLFTKMRVYAVASISGGDPRLPTHRTYADREGGRNPMWHAPLRFTIPPAADPRGLALHVLLRAERAFGDRDVGEVVVPMKDLAAASPEGDGAEQRHLSYQVRRPVSGRKRGVLHISYRLSDAPAPGPDAHPQHHRFSLAPPPSSFASKRHHGKGADSAITAYPVATTPRGGARQYPPPYHHQPYGYGGPGAAYPHHHQYGYGAYGYGGAPHGGAPYGYGGHSAAPAARSGGAGMGTAAGLGLGLLGGLMIGDMIADNDVDAAYDGGFMDGAMGC